MANGLVGLPRRGLQHGVSHGGAKKLWIKIFVGRQRPALAGGTAENAKRRSDYR